MSKRFNCKPSEILKIQDEYTAFCFDEACCYILNKIEHGEKPRYNKTKQELEQKKVTKHYTNFADFYKDIGG